MTLITQAECNRAYLEADQFVGREPWEDEKFPVGLNDTGEDSRAPHGEVGHHLGAAEEAGIRVEDIIESVNEIRKIMLLIKTHTRIWNWFSDSIKFLFYN